MTVELDDRITIATPEGVELDLALAGLGSRFIAGAVDLIVQGLATLILAVITGTVAGSGGLLEVVFVIGAFALWFFYNVGFELVAAGRTPGKRMSHLRVVRETGAPVDLPASAIRNLMRLLDGPALLYLPTVVSIALTRRNQRPGDLAAGTIVIRENPAASPARSAIDPQSIEGWDVSAVSSQEVAAVRRFLERRDTLERVARRELALRLANGLRPKVAGAPPRLDSERFLEQLAGAKASRR